MRCWWAKNEVEPLPEETSEATQASSDLMSTDNKALMSPDEGDSC
jgi:hypothetical protein